MVLIGFKSIGCTKNLVTVGEGLIGCRVAKGFMLDLYRLAPAALFFLSGGCGLAKS